MFTIPAIHNINVLSTDQKTNLCQGITEYIDCYISDNRLPIRIKESIQLDKYLDIKYNIENSNELLQKLISNEINISVLPWLEPHKLDNSLWKIHIDKRDRTRDTKEKMATINIFKCHKCGEMKCTTYQLQTASIDEPMTTYISCKVCGNSWKV